MGKNYKKNLFGILVALGVIILGVVAGFVVIHTMNRSSEEEIVEPADDGEVTLERIQQYISEMDKKIRKTKGSEKKAELYSERADYVSNYAVEWDNTELKEKVLSDAHEAEKLNPTAMSAYNVSYYEGLFGDKEKEDHYYDLAEKRGLNEEIKDAWK